MAKSMLEEITIQNLAGIESAKIEFGPGLSVITGESGAGKSILLSSLHLLMGRRADAAMVRHGAVQASAEGCWAITAPAVLTAVEECGGEVDEGQLFINRTVKADGKSRAVVGGKSTPTKTLSTLSDQLVSIHGQADQLRLRSVEAQLDALDRFAKAQIATVRSQYSQAYRSWRALERELKELRTHAEARRFEFEALKIFQTEFDNLDPQVDEIDALDSLIDRLSHLDSIREGVSEALSQLNPEDYDAAPAEAQLENVHRSLQKLVQYDSALEPIVTAVEAALDAVSEASSGLETYYSSLDEDGLEQLYSAQERQRELKTFVKKHGLSLNALIEKAETVHARIEELDPEKHSVESVEEDLALALKDLTLKAGKLTKVRVAAARKLEKAVNGELAGLAMSGTELVLQVEPMAFSPTGADNVAFMLTTPGSPTPRPISKAASGGELSRIMLALEVVLADPEETPTFVFDEVDAGVGGATAIEIGKRLALLAKEAQVIVVTHLPQVAAFGSQHLRVSKSTDKGATVTDIVTLSEAQRVQELTRMLSGLTGSETGQAHAVELLELARTL